MKSRYDLRLFFAVTKKGGVANDAHQRLENLMSQPGDDSEKDASEDDAWSLTQGSDHEDGLEDDVGDSENEAVHSLEIDY